MKRMIFSFSFLLYIAGAYAQITLEECQRKTQENYPLVYQYGLVEKTKEYNLENAAKGYLPQFALSAKASYQSEVTERSISCDVGVTTENLGWWRNPDAEETNDCGSGDRERKTECGYVCAK